MSDAHIILAGQSNALGYLNDGPAPYAPTARVQIWALQPDGSRAWNYMLPGANTGTLANPNVWGPEVQFANRWLAANPLGILWIVKSVKGETGLAVDPAGGHLDWSPDSVGELYDQTTALVTAAKANLTGGQYAFNDYDAVLWMQGEQDATAEASANAYHDNLVGLIEAVRDDWFVERFLMGRITDSAALPFNLMVRNAQWQVPMDDPEAFSFKTIGYTTREDTIHYDDQGHVRLGNGFYTLFEGP